MQMKIVDMKGLILSETNYGDSSKILNVLAETYGVIGILSKGSRGLKSKLRGVSRKLIYGTFHFYYKPNGLSTLIGVDVINDYDKILMDLEKIVYASAILDLIKQVEKQTDNSKEILEMSYQTLDKIEQGLDASVMFSILELKLLDFLGVSPNLDACAICGKKTGIISISVTAGGLICNTCDQSDGYYNEKMIKLLRMYYYVDITKITKIEINSKVNEEIQNFLEDYYDRYTGIYLKSKKMLKNMAKFVEK